MEAEEYAELLSSIRDTFERVVDRHGGTIVQIIGDGALASFGYPSSREDDGRRAVEAALELRDAIEKLDFDLRIDAVVNERAAHMSPRLFAFEV